MQRQQHRFSVRAQGPRIEGSEPGVLRENDLKSHALGRAPGWSGVSGGRAPARANRLWLTSEGEVGTIGLNWKRKVESASAITAPSTRA